MAIDSDIELMPIERKVDNTDGALTSVGRQCQISKRTQQIQQREIGIAGLDSQPTSNPRAKHFIQALHTLTEIEVLRVKEGTCARAWKSAEIWSSDILPTDEVTMKVSAHVAAIRQGI